MFNKKTVYKTFSLAVATLVLIGIYIEPLQAKPQWDDTSLYPAKVKAIKFASGHSIDMLHSVSWGSWTVSFGNELPKAANGDCGSQDGCRHYGIRMLRCSNKIVGESDCFMSLTVEGVFRGKNEPSCLVSGESIT